MGKEITARYLVKRKVEDALLPEIVSAAYRLENLADEILEAKEPSQDKRRLDEMKDGLLNIRMCAETLHR